MGTTRLDLYNAALLHCGERSLSSLSETREPRRLLDVVWNGNGRDYCLERGQWYFAMRAILIDPDPSISPSFGYSNAFQKPSDWINTSAVCSDEFFRVPLRQYADEVGYWYADITPIYVKYVSNDANYGGDLSKWPATFTDYVAVYFASRIIGKLAGDQSGPLKQIFGPPGRPEEGLLERNYHIAKSQAAMTQPTVYPAEGAWVLARRGRRSGYNDRGNPGSLIG